jgi:hypothetical protein
VKLNLLATSLETAEGFEGELKRAIEELFGFNSIFMRIFLISKGFPKLLRIFL